MRQKLLRSGRLAYFWELTTRDRRRGCPLHSEALGTDYGDVCTKASILNAQLDAWRDHNAAVQTNPTQYARGSMAWLVNEYLRSPAFGKHVSKRSRPEYVRALHRILDMTTKDDRTVGRLQVASITPAAVDKIYERLQVGPRGPRVRQANLSIDVMRRAWKIVRRLEPNVVPMENPWEGVLKVISKKTKPAATRAEAYTLANTLSEIGEPHLGVAALICFE